MFNLNKRRKNKLINFVKCLEKIILLQDGGIIAVLSVIILITGCCVVKFRNKHADIIKKLENKGAEYIEKCTTSELKVIKKYSYRTLFFITFWELFMGCILLIAILYIIFLIITWGHFENFTKFQNYISNKISEVESGTFIVLIVWCLKKPLALFVKLLLTLFPISRDLLETVNILKKPEIYLDFIKLSKAKIKELEKVNQNENRICTRLNNRSKYKPTNSKVRNRKLPKNISRKSVR